MIDETVAERARRRFQMLTGLRLAGLMAAATGVALWQGWVFGVVAPGYGRGTLALGIAFLFVLPAILRRRWRREP